MNATPTQPYSALLRPTTTTPDMGEDCGSCGAAANEDCRPGCIGQAAHMDELGFTSPELAAEAEDEDGEPTDEDAEQLIADALYDAEGLRSIQTFRDAGVMTNNRGLVINTADGSEFQLTIVRSR
jgi:hypothetical protein